MTKEELLSDIQSLIKDIDKCKNEFVRSSLKGDTEAFVKTLHEVERLLPAAHQELTFLYDYIGGLWKDANGDELPEIDREVIVLIQDFPQYPEALKVGYGHRPDPKGWDGKSLRTGKVEHYTAETYGKGGWNLPNIKFWLDLDFPMKEGGE